MGRHGPSWAVMGGAWVGPGREGRGSDGLENEPGRAQNRGAKGLASTGTARAGADGDGPLGPNNNGASTRAMRALARAGGAPDRASQASARGARIIEALRCERARRVRYCMWPTLL